METDSNLSYSNQQIFYLVLIPAIFSLTGCKTKYSSMSTQESHLLLCDMHNSENWPQFMYCITIKWLPVY